MLVFLAAWHEERSEMEPNEGCAATIEVVDGPAWWITVDLRGTGLEGQTLEPTVVDLGGGRWHQSWSDGLTFTAATSVRELVAGAAEFRTFVRRKDRAVEPRSSGKVTVGVGHLRDFAD